MRYLIVLLVSLITLFTLPQSVLAAPIVAGASAHLASDIVTLQKDNRAKILEKYLQKYDSPLVPYANTFVAEADKNNIDWRLLVAISGVESTFAKHIPVRSYNAWGWGIYGDNSMGFTSWNEAISTISKELRARYIDKWGAQNVYQIGRFYAASPTWAVRVDSFMGQIDTFGTQYQNSQLSISI